MINTGLSDFIYLFSFGRSGVPLDRNACWELALALALASGYCSVLVVVVVTDWWNGQEVM